MEPAPEEAPAADPATEEAKVDPDAPPEPMDPETALKVLLQCLRPPAQRWPS